MAHATSMDGIASLMSRVDIAGDNGPPTSPANATLHAICRDLVIMAERAKCQARNIDEGQDDTDGQDVAKLISLRLTLNDLQNMHQKITCSLDESITADLISHAKNSYVQGMLRYFKPEIKTIVKRVLDTGAKNEDMRLSILERCYNESLNPSGCLHSQKYFDAHGNLHWRLLYKKHAPAERKGSHGVEASVKREVGTYNRWIEYWFRQLARLSDGPTLFWPLARRDSQCDIPNVPRYLFRAYDLKSSGKSNETTVESTMFERNPAAKKIDILSLDEPCATHMLNGHLLKPLLRTDSPLSENEKDNLMSWSSSLMFTIQYAIYRCKKFHLDPADVKICAVDVARFPRGQFARDLWLMETIATGTEENPEIDNLLRLRRFYDNSEYLTQGALRHQGRSSTCSLQKLIDRGLDELYPAFADPDGALQWTKRVESIRRQGSQMRESQDCELTFAVRIASTCFPGMRPAYMAALLLAFQNRQIRNPGSPGPQAPAQTYNEPEEVQRYQDVIRILDKLSLERSGGPIDVIAPTDLDVLRKLYVCGDR